VAATTARRRSSGSGFSIFRIALIIGLVGIVIIAAWAGWFLLDQASRRVPFDVTLYPNAEFWGDSNVQAGFRKLFYRTIDSPETVAAFYQQRLDEHNGGSGERCVRIPPEGVDREADNDLSRLPYQFKCVFDRSGFNATQFTEVYIHPGRFNTDPFLNAQGLTIIRYDQQWQP
jgi:hypothetical protein